MPLQASFILPDAPAEAQTAFAWWDGFTDPHTAITLPAPGGPVPTLPEGAGNAVNRPEADNTDARLFQTATPTAFITSTQGIYSFAEQPSFLIQDIPAFEADSVLLQTRSLGALPQLDSAELFYRESADGVLKSVGGATAGEGFLLDAGEAYAMWEWDLSQQNVYELFLTFDASGTAMSLQEVQLDTFDTVTDNLGVALVIETNANFAPVGEIEHAKVGASTPQPTYRPGDTVELTPVMDPAFDYAFVGWGGDLAGTAVPASLTIDANPFVEAVFAPKRYDGWAANAINPFLSGASFQERSQADADPDGDGLTNLLEYALGTAPEAATLGAERPRASPADGDRSRFTYRRQMAAEDLTYRVKVSANLVDWYYNGDGTGRTYTEPVGPPQFNGDGTETVTVQSVPGTLTEAPRFFQLEILWDTP